MQLTSWLHGAFSKFGTNPVKRHRGLSKMGPCLESLEARAMLTSPFFTSQPTDNVFENDSYAKLAQADDAEGDTLTFSIVGTGQDDALFNIDANTGDITFITPPDFENPDDANQDYVYEINVMVEDGIDPAAFQTIELTLQDVNDETPTFVSDAFVTLDEGLTDVQTVLANDLDANSQLTYALTGNGADDVLFNIDPATGAVTFAIITDFANPVDADQNNIYEFEVEVSDGLNKASQTVQVAVQQAATLPTLALTGGVVTFKKGQAGVKPLAGVTVTGKNLEGGQLILSINAINGGKKVADVVNTNKLNQLGTFFGQQVGDRVVVTFTLGAGVTAADVEEAIRDIQFATFKKGLKFPSRTVKAQLIDNQGHASVQLTQTINVRKK